MDYGHLTILQLMQMIGVDTTDTDLSKTPQRMVRALLEMTAGVNEDAADILATTFDARGYDSMILLRDIEFTSLCEHHVLPFTGRATVGYIPGERVVGLSKLARLVACFARRAQIQERLTVQVAEAIRDHLGAPGVGVIVEARHECMACRGAKQPRATMITSTLLGKFRDPEVRAEFLGLKG